MHKLISEILINDVEPVQRYAVIVGAFGQLTSITNPATGLCCSDVKKGVPKCCYTLIDGTCELTFTETEIITLSYGGVNLAKSGINLVKNIRDLGQDSVWVAKVKHQGEMRDSLHTGDLSKTLECASHPTRPVINDGVVTGVVVVKDCIAEYAMPLLKKQAEDYLWLWKQAVEHFGVKPYYITRGFDNPDQFEWLIDELTA
jgi:hypothetical protein